MLSGSRLILSPCRVVFRRTGDGTCVVVCGEDTGASAPDRIDPCRNVASRLQSDTYIVGDERRFYGLTIRREMTTNSSYSLRKQTQHSSAAEGGGTASAVSRTGITAEQVPRTETLHAEERSSCHAIESIDTY